jgi:hypothetical protein
MKDKILTTALKYIKIGLSVVVTDNSKRALFPWKKYQEKVITEAEFREQLSHEKAAGVAIICGAVSGGLEVVDIDLKYDLSGKLFTELKKELFEQGLWEKLLAIKTRSGGYHLYYRCEVIEGNQKLALRSASEEELKDNPQLKQICLIETRGEAGYVIAPPTEGYTKSSGSGITVLSIDERDSLLSVCRSFNQVFETPVVDIKSRPDAKEYGLSPFEDYNKRGDVVSLLRDHGWKVVKQIDGKTVFKRPGTSESRSSGDYNHNLGWFSVFTTNSCFEPNKAYLPYAVFTILECGGDFKEAARKLLDLGYGERRQSYGSKIEREVFKRKQDGMDKDGLITYVVQHEKKTVEEAREIIDTLEKQWGEKLCTFWDIDKHGKININRTRMERFLTDTGGFHLYFYDPHSNIYRLVRVRDGFVEDVSTEQIKKFIKDYINRLPETFDGGVTPQDLLEVVYKGADSYFSKGFLEFLDNVQLDFLRDTPDEAFFPFKKGVVVVGRTGARFKSYGDIGKVIWKSEVIDFDITLDPDFDSALCEYYRFIEKICDEDDDRIFYCLSLIGYLLHKYKDPAKPYAVILAEETENESVGGGTGKGIFVKAISYLMNTERVDGKNFKLDKNFAFQRVGLDTKLVAIEDVRKNVDFEGFYSIITEGITVEKKNKDELFIPYKDSPKIIFTTNYTIPSVGNHAKRRQRVFEFANFFSSKYTPMDHFKHKLFDDWDSDEWNRFYNLLFFCLQMYLKEGVKDPGNSQKLKRKHVRLAFGEEFMDYWDQMIGNGRANWHMFSQEYTAFLKQNDMDKKDYSQKRFKKALGDTAEMTGYLYENRRNWQAAGQMEFRLTHVPHDAT